MSFQLDAACLCNTGRVRKNNEDNFYFDGQRMEAENNGLRQPLVMTRNLNQGVCVAVFDGMGGENFGEFASFAAANRMQALAAKLNSGFPVDQKYLNRVCLAINDAVVARQRELCTERMGSTLVGFYFSRNSVYAYNLGDSRAYRLRGGVLKQLSEDHVEHREGRSTRKAPLIQHLGINPEDYLIEPTIVKDELQTGDWYLLCSDGLTDMLNDEEIGAILQQSSGAEDCARMLVDAALEHGGRDNVTVIVGRVQAVADEPLATPGVRAEMGRPVAMPAAARPAAPNALGEEKPARSKKKLILIAGCAAVAVLALVLVLLLLPKGEKPEAAETPVESTVPTEAPTPAPVIEVMPTPEPEEEQPYDGSPYTAERVREGAEKAASDPTLNYSLTNAAGAELELPKGKEFIEYPMQMKAFAGESAWFDLLPTPNAGQEALGRMNSGDEVWVVAIRAHDAEKADDGAPQIYYLAVAEDGRAGWNKKEAFQVSTEVVGCKDGHGEWLPATCVRPETCKNCGATRGELGDHKWKAATCQAPETCEICGHTKGGLGNHRWDDTGKCLICGDTKSEEIEQSEDGEDGGKTDPEPGSDSNPGSKPEPNPNPNPNPDPNPNPNPDPNPNPNPNPNPDPGPDPDPDPDPSEDDPSNDLWDPRTWLRFLLP